ncbi:MAG: histidinol-phosphatase HisJ [Promethearchaeota archaeon]|nr:MAG: histidinol-phosphatase HisJ [Candidatus Lokiarchaeota archaeon]
MKFEDFHTHNKLCRHAQGNIKDYIEAAIDKNLKTIGISDHFPYEIYSNMEGIPYEEYSMTVKEIQKYLFTIQEAKKKYKKEINVRASFEVDFIINQVPVLNNILDNIKTQLDYILGSIHVLYSERGPWCFDDSRFLGEFNNYESVNDVYLHYYNTMLEMVQEKAFDFDIVSHFDLPKKFNKRPEDDALIMDKIIEVLKQIKERELTIEINTSGFRKEVGEQYPSMKIIQKIHELDIPIVLSSDAHNPKEVGYKFDFMIQKLKEIGFKKLASFENRKRTFIQID